MTRETLALPTTIYAGGCEGEGGSARTNHLVECALCPPEQGPHRPVLWRYNLSAHHDSAHSSHAKPQGALVGELERDLVKTVGGDRKRQLT